MKKFFTTILVCMLSVLILSMTACNNVKGEPYYPDSNEMKTNLVNNGYTVNIITDLGSKNGTYLSATKETEYIYYYRLENAVDCTYYYNFLEENHPDYNSLVKIENDEKFGNIVYCGTANAVNDSGIKVVKVKV